MIARHVRPNRRASKASVSAALAAAWGRVAFAHGKGALADAIEGDVRCINRALTSETLPELHRAINSLTLDPTALDEVLALVGFRAVPVSVDAAGDMALVSGLSGAVADYLERMADGRIDHVDEAALALKFRPLLAQMQAVVERSDRRRGLRGVTAA